MNRKRLFLAISVTLGLAVLAGAGFVAAELWDDHQDHRKERSNADLMQATADGSLVPLARILELTAQQVPGQVLKVEVEDDHGRHIYEIKVLAANGRVRELKFDARNAQLIEIEDD
jgi:uncharacterized membrane protein YkoI